APAVSAGGDAGRYRASVVRRRLPRTGTVVVISVVIVTIVAARRLSVRLFAVAAGLLGLSVGLLPRRAAVVVAGAVAAASGLVTGAGVGGRVALGRAGDRLVGLPRARGRFGAVAATGVGGRLLGLPGAGTGFPGAPGTG